MLSEKSRLGQKVVVRRRRRRRNNVSCGLRWENRKRSRRSSYGRVLYNYFRTYDPSTGRYLESDPSGLSGGLNTYGYAAGNPLTYFDPYGLRPLTAREKCLLSPYIPEEDLENADLRDSKVPWFLRKKFDAITRGNKIYFREGVYDSNTVAGIALLGHELVHVGQYREGMTWLKYLWSTREGYYPSKYETPAYDLQWRIRRELAEEDVKECDPCEQ